MEKKVVDIAKWNVISDYTKLKNAGVDGAIVKVINSANNVDGLFYTHCKGLRKAGIPIIGGYNYLYANTIAKAHAVAPKFMQLCKSEGIKTAWMDIEDGCMKNLGSTLADIINIYYKYAKQYDIYLGIYTGGPFYNSYIKPFKKMIPDLPIWFARYPSGTKSYIVRENIPSTKNLPTSLDLDGWQYTSKCRIPGINCYLDLSVWWENTPFVNLEPSEAIKANPYTEPIFNVSNGTMGNDANWVQWYMWRFGKLVDKNGNPDTTLINGMIGNDDVKIIKELQSLLGLKSDGIVGSVTRSIWKKIC